jgi:hypothetical protein
MSPQIIEQNRPEGLAASVNQLRRKMRSQYAKPLFFQFGDFALSNHEYVLPQENQSVKEPELADRGTSWPVSVSNLKMGNPGIDVASLRRGWPHRTHESNWLKDVVCALGLATI